MLRFYVEQLTGLIVVVTLLSRVKRGNGAIILFPVLSTRAVQFAVTDCFVKQFHRTSSCNKGWQIANNLCIVNLMFIGPCIILIVE